MRFLKVIILFVCLACAAWAGSATDITGLYYTGINNSYGLLADASQDSHWTVAYARVNGASYTGNSTYTGNSYVLSANYIDAAYVANSGSSKWITAPGASTSAAGTNVNIGGDFLPGDGTTGTNRAQFVYRLAFNVVGTGSGTVTNNISISLTIAADDQYSVYVNPSLNSNGSVNTGSTLAGSRTNAWNNTSAVYLQNFSNSNSSANSSFVIGTNYIYVVVDNTNSLTGNQSISDLNPSGLLVYQVGSAMTIDGHVIPEPSFYGLILIPISLGLLYSKKRLDIL
jgi:hypothetical protein